ncbi:exported hypothetical protein [Mesorhizobium plurifarium]|uniref:Uncharacterized protein n=1 Tax=Mesorhizobium plurifarium TaxID=69974 RepID=A0A090FZI9_MESPL|nr:exported hypothetical protein [Mesorhizobium plurifarium]
MRRQRAPRPCLRASAGSMAGLSGSRSGQMPGREKLLRVNDEPLYQATGETAKGVMRRGDCRRNSPSQQPCFRPSRRSRRRACKA